MTADPRSTSSVSDLVRFGMAVNRGRLLKPSTVELLQASQRLTSGEETGYGLGWYVKTVTLAGKQTRVIGHDGDSLGGMVASLMTVPSHGIVVAVTSNISYADTFSPRGENCGGVCGPWRKSSDQLTRTSVPFVNHLQHAIRSRARFHTVRRPPCPNDLNLANLNASIMRR